MTIASECTENERSSAVPRDRVTAQTIRRFSLCEACGEVLAMDIGYELPCAVHHAHMPFFSTKASAHPARVSADATIGAASTPPEPTTATGMDRSNPAPSNISRKFSSATSNNRAYGKFFAPGM